MTAPSSSRTLLRPLAALRQALAMQRAAYAAPASAPATPPPPPPKGAYVLPLPKLSPQMQRGAVAAWRVREGEAFPAYTVLAEVTTTELVEAAYAEGAFAGRVRMLVEAQQPGTVARLLVPADDDDDNSAAAPRDMQVGTPIAVVVGQDELEDAPTEAEREGMVAAARAWAGAIARAGSGGGAGDGGDGGGGWRDVEWQSYLADDKGKGQGGCG